MRRLTIIVIIISVTTRISSAAYRSIRYNIPCRTDLQQQYIEQIESQVGFTEKNHSHTDTNLYKYYRAAGLPVHGRYPYCASGVQWGFRSACDVLHIAYTNIPIKRTGSANAIYDAAASSGQKDYYRATVPCLLIWKHYNNYNGHIESAIRIINNMLVRTVGFNTTSGIRGNQRNGNGVYYRYRSLYSPLGSMLVRGIVGFSHV